MLMLMLIYYNTLYVVDADDSDTLSGPEWPRTAKDEVTARVQLANPAWL